MFPVLFISSSPVQQQTFIDTQLANLAILPKHQCIISAEDDKKGITINQIRLSYQFFRSVPAEKKGAIIFLSLDKASRHAQNALLKIIEEPPENVLVIITAQNKELIVQTIQSRCVVHTTQNQIKPIDKAVLTIMTQDKSKRFEFAQNTSDDKENAKKWLEDVLQYLHHQLHHKPLHSKDLLTTNTPILKQCYKSLIALENTNVTPRLLLENLLLQLPEISSKKI